MAAFLDTNVFLYAIGADHPLREPCRELLVRVGDGRVEATTSTEVVQELLYVLDRRGRRRDGLKLAGHVIALFPGLLPVRREEMERALDVVKGDPTLPVRDAIHAATLLNHGLSVIISADGHFDRLPALRRLSPEAAVS